MNPAWRLGFIYPHFHMSFSQAYWKKICPLWQSLCFLRYSQTYWLGSSHLFCCSQPPSSIPRQWHWSDAGVHGYMRPCRLANPNSTGQAHRVRDPGKSWCCSSTSKAICCHNTLFWGKVSLSSLKICRCLVEAHLHYGGQFAFSESTDWMLISPKSTSEKHPE